MKLIYIKIIIAIICIVGTAICLYEMWLNAPATDRAMKEMMNAIVNRTKQPW